MPQPPTPLRPRNDLRQYDDLTHAWWQSAGPFAALHWLAEARARMVPPAASQDAVLVDVGCGGGLLAAHLHGYRHVGVDRTASALQVARRHGVVPVRGDATALPLGNEVADVVVAGEIIEHVTDVESLVQEVVRVCRPGGTIVVDTIADTAWARWSLVTVGERMPGGPPRHIHDPDLFVSPQRLRALFAGHGVTLQVTGLRPDPLRYLGFLLDRRRRVRMVPIASASAVYQGVGRRGPAGTEDARPRQGSRRV